MGFFSDYRSSQYELCSEIDDQFDAFLDAYFVYLKDRPVEPGHHFKTTLIARSPESPAAMAIARCAVELYESNVTLRTIFAHLTPAEAISEWLDPSSDLQLICPQSSIRWTKNPNLLDAHEQLILGHSMCWSGDPMRRTPGRRDTMDLFEEQCPGTARLGQLAFEALWNASLPVPAGQMKRHGSRLVQAQNTFTSLEHTTTNNSVEPNFYSWLPTRH